MRGDPMPTLRLTVNGRPVQAEVEPGLLLVDLLRRTLNLTGTHIGCDTGQCGACTVVVDGAAVRACSQLALQAQGASITTVEGLAQNGRPHPLQEAFTQCHGLQCGFCTPGFLMSAAALLQSNPTPSEADIVDALEGNLCRCTGYVNIVAAVQQAARLQRGEAA
jgi:aerobic carbon-monoxide dehydrogenase small subunit